MCWRLVSILTYHPFWAKKILNTHWQIVAQCMLLFDIFPKLSSGPWFNIKISYQYRKSRCGDKTILRPSYLHNGIFYTGKKTSLHWIRALLVCRYIGTEGADLMRQGYHVRISSISTSHPGTLKTAPAEAGPRLNIKTVLSTYGDFHVKDKTAVRTSYL